MKIMKKAICIAAAFCMLAASGCTKSDDTSSDNNASQDASTEQAAAIEYPVTIKVGYSTNADDPRGVVLEEMKKTVEAETNGDIIFEIHPSGELGSDSDLISGLMSGNVDMTVSSAGNYATYATRMGVSALPFLFSDFESAWKFVDSDIMQGIEPELEQYNMHVLAYFDNGFRCVTTTEKAGAVNSVADMNGLNIRTPDNQIVMETMSALGANPQIFPFAELAEALKTGKFDAQENPIPVIYNNKLYEVQKYLSITNHSYDAMPLTIRNDLWQSLKPEYRKIIEEAATAAEKHDRELVKKQTEDYVALLEKEGMEVSYPDLAAFKDATSGVMDVFAKMYGDELIDSVKKYTSN